MNNRHKHADLIHAWADGAEIQIKTDKGDWITCIAYPNWLDTCEYRIKPEEKKPVVRWLWADEDGRHFTDSFWKEAPNGFPVKLEWSRTEFPE